MINRIKFVDDKDAEICLLLFNEQFLCPFLKCKGKEYE